MVFGAGSSGCADGKIAMKFSSINWNFRGRGDGGGGGVFWEREDDACWIGTLKGS